MIIMYHMLCKTKYNFIMSLRTILSFLLLTLIVSCGNKGALFIPDQSDTVESTESSSDNVEQ